MATTKETAAAKAATTPPVPLTLQQKFIKLREAVPSITQKAHSDGVKYKFAKIFDVYQLLTPAMNEFGVNFDIVGEQATRHSENGDPIYYSNFTQHTRNGDRIVWVYEADLTIRWTNADNPDETLEVTLHAIGTNDGGPDKAKGSAWTYCLKYYLFEKFGIDQGDDDPDMSDHSSEPPQQSQKQHTGAQNGNRQGNTQPQAQNGQTGRSGAARPLSDAQLSRLYRKGEDAGSTQPDAGPVRRSLRRYGQRKAARRTRQCLIMWSFWAVWLRSLKSDTHRAAHQWRASTSPCRYRVRTKTPLRTISRSCAGENAPSFAAATSLKAARL